MYPYFPTTRLMISGKLGEPYNLQYSYEYKRIYYFEQQHIW